MFAKFNGFKYSNQIQIIHTQLYDFKYLFQFNLNFFAQSYMVSGINLIFDQMSRVFVNCPGLDAALLSTKHYKGRIKDKVEQSWERISVFSSTSVK